MQVFQKIYTHLRLLVFQLGDFWPFGTSPPRGRPFETLRKGEPPLQDTARKELQGTSMDISGHKGYYRCLRDFSILSLLLSHRSLILWNLGTIFLKKKRGKTGDCQWCFFFFRGVGNSKVMVHSYQCWGQKSPTYHACVNFPFPTKKLLAFHRNRCIAF